MNIETTKAELIGIIEATQDEGVLHETTSYLKQRLEQPSYSEEEAELIDKIKNGLSKEFTIRYRELSLKFLRREITENENVEYKKMIEKSEQFAADRIYYMIDLAEIWKTDVNDVMLRLNIKPPEPLSV